MPHKILVIAANTFKETIRQPIYAIILVIAMIMFALAPSLSLFTISEDARLLREIGLSTLFLSGLFIAVFSASGAIAREIENKTVTTVLTKPVRRPVFIIGKYVGLTAALALAMYICTLAFLMAVRNGIVESEHHHVADWPVLIVASATIIISVLLAGFFNYFYDWKFSSTAIVIAAIVSTIGMAFLYFFDRQWQFNPAENGFAAFEVNAALLLFIAAVTMLSIAVALSTRFNIVVTLAGCIGFFMLGLISDYIYGQLRESAHTSVQYLGAAGRAILPSLQVFWVSDAYHEGTVVTLSYVGSVGIYALCYSAAALLIAIALFQKRQLG